MSGKSEEIRHTSLPATPVYMRKYDRHVTMVTDPCLRWNEKAHYVTLNWILPVNKKWITSWKELLYISNMKISQVMYTQQTYSTHQSIPHWNYISDLTWDESCRLKSTAMRLLVQQLVLANNNGNIEFQHYWLSMRAVRRKVFQCHDVIKIYAIWYKAFYNGNN